VVPAHEMTGPAGPISSSNRSNWSLDGLFVWHLEPGSVQLVQRTGRLVVWFGHWRRLRLDDHDHAGSDSDDDDDDDESQLAGLVGARAG